MSLTLIAAVAAAVAASVGYLAARRGRDVEAQGEDEPAGKRAAPGAGGGGEASPFEGLPLGLGDVVVAGSEERWLAGALVAREQGETMAVVFVAPEGGKQHAIAVFAPPRRDVYWLAPAEVDSPEEPPATLEIAGVTMRRRARRPVAIERLGQGAPPAGEAGILGDYAGGGSDVAVVVASEGRVYAWAGRRLEPDEYERLGGGGDDT